MSNERTPLTWRQRRVPKRGTRRARNWRRIQPGYCFPGSAWVVVEGPYRRIRRDKSKSFVTVRCELCQWQYERRLDHLVQGLSRACVHCAPRFHRVGHGT
jgi:hypothetical protein